MARFKEHEKEAQKEISFDVETSTVDADIEAPKPVQVVAKPAALIVKPVLTSKVDPAT